MIRLYIDNNLSLRWNEWPKEAFPVDKEEARVARIHYASALEKAKAESILVVDYYYTGTPDSFIDLPLTVVIVFQALQGDVWADVIESYYEKMHRKEPDRFRKVARLVPAKVPTEAQRIVKDAKGLPVGFEPMNPSHSYTEGADLYHVWDKENKDLKIVSADTVIEDLKSKLAAAEKRVKELEAENKRLWNILHDASS